MKGTRSILLTITNEVPSFVSVIGEKRIELRSRENLNGLTVSHSMGSVMGGLPRLELLKPRTASFSEVMHQLGGLTRMVDLNTMTRCNLLFSQFRIVKTLKRNVVRSKLIECGTRLLVLRMTTQLLEVVTFHAAVMANSFPCLSGSRTRVKGVHIVKTDMDSARKMTKGLGRI
jgi:hypothetical protein